MNKGSIALARSQCEQIRGELGEGEVYGSVDIAEILSAEIEALQSENEALQINIADGDIIINRLSAENNRLHMELDAAMAHVDTLKVTIKYITHPRSPLPDDEILKL